MRKAKEKDFGYVILPVAVPAGTSREEAMKDNRRFKVVWDVLNALRSHDERFEAMINSIDLDGDTKGKIGFDVIGKDGAVDSDADSGDGSDKKSGQSVQMPLFDLAEWKDAILARIVRNFGSREYWDAWADDVVDINANQVARIRALLGRGDAAMDERFATFYDSVRRRAEAIITPAGRQAVVHELYEQFFKKAFPKQSSSLGVVYTPVEIVDVTSARACSVRAGSVR